MVECLPSIQSARLAPERHKNHTNELLCPGAVTGKLAPLLGGLGTSPLLWEGKPCSAQRAYLEMLLGHGNGATLGVHRTLPGAVPVRIILLPEVLVCRTLSLCYPHIKNHRKERIVAAVKIQPHAGSHCAACHQSPLLHHHGTQL